MSEYIFKETGSIEQDDKNLKKIYSDIHKNEEPATIVVEGTPYISSPHAIKKPIGISWRGSNPSCGLRVMPDAQINYFFNRSSLSSVWDSKVVDLPEGVNEGDSSIVPIEGAEIGDFVILFGDDHLTGMTPHVRGGSQRPEEIHEIVDIHEDGRLYFGSVIQDTMKKNSGVRLIKRREMVPPFSIENLRLIPGIPYNGSDRKTHINGELFNIRFAYGTHINNVIIENDGPGGFFINYACNVTVDNLSCHGVQHKNTRYSMQVLYLLVVGAVNGVTWGNSIVNDVRHAFTTTSSRNNGGHRYGTPFNVLVHDHVARNTSDKRQGDGISREFKANVIYDTHAEGKNIVFDGIVCEVGGETVNRFANSRSRGTIFKNCVIKGGPGGIADGIFLSADDCRVENCDFQNLLTGIRSTHDYSLNRIAIEGNRFRDILTACYWLRSNTSGDYHRFNNNTVYNCGQRRYRSSVFPEKSHLVVLSSGKNHEVCNNVFNKYDNENAVFSKEDETRVANNTCLGYGDENAGLSANLREQFDSKNITDGDPKNDSRKLEGLLRQLLVALTR